MASEYVVPVDTAVPPELSAAAIATQHQRLEWQMAAVPVYNLQQLSDVEASENYERLVAYERVVASADLTLRGYEHDAAVIDSLFVREGQGAGLLSVEHATNHVRHWESGKVETIPADYGTAALGYALHEDMEAGFVAAIDGGDANYEPMHPLKERLAELLPASNVTGHFSLHGMGRALVSSLTDDRGYSVLLGIGPEPTLETLDTVDKMVALADDYGLRVGVNQTTLRFKVDTYDLRTDEDGKPLTITFAASNENTTRAFTQRTAAELGKSLVAVQVEISDVLRLLPLDHPRYPGKRSQVMGTYLATLFMKDCLRLLEPAHG